MCLLLSQLVAAQQPASNDGFQRRNGQMQVVRNGQARAMLRDAHLPSGAVVTKDGFVISATGQRTELREGQGCDLRGRPVAVRTLATGGLVLAGPAPASRARVYRDLPRPVLEAAAGPRFEEDENWFSNGKKWEKHHGKGHGKGHGHGHRKHEDEDED